MIILNEMLWAGTEASFQSALTAAEGIEARVKAGQIEAEVGGSLLEVDDDGLAVIPVHGSLTSEDSPFNQLFGLTSYGQIRAALIEAAENPSVKHILMDYNTGGGAVVGLADTAKLISMVNDRVKPVTAYAENAYSAGYWLASSAGNVFASEGSGVGSIGILARHAENSKQLEAQGIKVTTLRSGSEKALATSTEPLTPEAEAQIRAKMDVNYRMFVKHVASRRGKSYEYTDKHLAQGKEFMGEAAYEAGITDGMLSYDEVVSKIKQNFLDSSISKTYTAGKQNSHLRAESIGDTVMVKKTLTEQDIAALAAGVNVGADVSAETPVGEVAGAVAETGAETDVVADAAADVQDQEVKPEAAAEVAKMDATVKFVSDQLKAAQDDLFATRLELSRLQDKHAEISAVVTPLKEIAAKAVNNMRVALRSAPLDMGAMSAAQVVAEHLAVASNFTKQFPVGGVASVSGAAEKEKKEFKLDSNLAARVNAVRGK